MGAGRRTETYLAPHFSSAGSSVSSSHSTQFRNLPASELASVIFGCSHATYEECVQQLIFGLPEHHYSYVKNIQPGKPLFLFNYSDRKLHGIFEADSNGGFNIKPSAWMGGKIGQTPFPAQVCVRVTHLCSPLLEKVFKGAIATNYLKDPPNHFYFELNHVQTDKLLSLFKRYNTYMSSQAGPLTWTQPGDHEGWIAPKKTLNSVMDAWNNAAPFVSAPDLTLPAQGEGRADTPEHWDDGSDKVENETRAGNGMQHELHGGASCSSFVESTKNVQDSARVESTKDVQDSAHVEWQQLAGEGCLWEQKMLRLECELLSDKLQALDVSVAKTINENLETCASSITQMREDQIKLRHVMDEAMNQTELLRELNQLRTRNASLENTQAQMASELEMLKSDVARMSQQLRNPNQ